MRRIPTLVLAALVAATPSAFAGDDAQAVACAETFQRTFDAAAGARENAAPEIVREWEEIDRGRYALHHRAADIDDRLASLALESWHLGFDREELDRKRADLRREADQVAAASADYERRNARHNKDVAVAQVCLSAAITPADYARCNQEGARLNQETASLLAEREAGASRVRAINARGEKLDDEGRALAARGAAFAGKQRRLSDELRAYLADCQAAIQRAAALGAVVVREGRGATRSHEERPARELAAEAGKDMLQEAVKDGLTPRLDRAVAPLLERELPQLFKALSRIGIEGEPVGAAVALADIVEAAGAAGVAARNREIDRDLWLVGDYATALQRIVAEDRGRAKSDPRYKALRAELLRYDREERTTALVLGEGYRTGDALVGALAEVMGQYAARRVVHSLTPGATARARQVLIHLDNRKRHLLGKGGLLFLRDLRVAPASGVTQVVVKSTSEEIHRLWEAAHAPRRQGDEP